MKSLRILIADDHPLVRQGIRTVIEAQPGWTLGWEADDGREAVRLALKYQPDVIILDLSMPELNGIDATRYILKEIPSAAILILTMHESENLAADILEAGAYGYVLKSDTPRLLVSAIESVADHKPFFAGKAGALLIQSHLKTVKGGQEEGGRGARLSSREREIVQLLAEGNTNKDVATRLGISVKTVDAHRTNIMRRLGFHSIAELVRYAVREKIIQA